MKRGYILITLFFVVLISLMIDISHAILINEIMPHTNNSWHDEWIELYNPNNETLNLSLWKIGDKTSNDSISLILPPFSFGLIVDSGTNKDNLTGCKAFNISNESCYELTTIGLGLNDDNETVFLYDNLNYSIDNFSWSESIKSTGYSWSKDNYSNWTTCSPTPGSINFCPENQSEEKPDNKSQNQSDNIIEQETDSSINIKDSPDKAQFGETIKVKVKIYKGDTSKYAIYAYVQDSDENRVSEKVTEHARTKFKEYSKTFEIKLDCLNKSGNYEIIVEGLGEEDSEDIYLESCYLISNIKVEQTPILIEENEYTPTSQANLLTTYPSLPITSYSVSEIPAFSFLKILFYALGGIIILLIISLIIKKARA